MQIMAFAAGVVIVEGNSKVHFEGGIFRLHRAQCMIYALVVDRFVIRDIVIAHVLCLCKIQMLTELTGKHMTADSLCRIHQAEGST